MGLEVVIDAIYEIIGLMRLFRNFVFFGIEFIIETINMLIDMFLENTEIIEWGIVLLPLLPLVYILLDFIKKF